MIVLSIECANARMKSVLLREMFVPSVCRFIRDILPCGVLFMFVGALSYGSGSAPPMKRLDLNSLAEFDSPGANWIVAGALAGDPRVEKDLIPVPGKGILINRATPAARKHLLTTWHHGDIELELEFLVPVGSNSGVYLQGRYEVQITDTWCKPRRASHDTGSIYQRWDATRPEGHKGYEGYSPLVEVERAPGLWQHLRIVFRAPRFDTMGKKVAPAHFDRVELNGVLVQEHRDVSGPTRAPGLEGEDASGPLMLQGDHGDVAFRNILYRSLPSPPRGAAFTIRPHAPLEKVRIEEGLCISGSRPAHQSVAVGSPTGIHYCCSVEDAALLLMWRGDFLGESGGAMNSRFGRFLIPGGSLVRHKEYPSLAWLQSAADVWPGSGTGAAVRTHGVDRDSEGQLLFRLSVGPRHGTEQFFARQDRRGLTMRVMLDGSRVSGPARSGAAWLLLAEAATIKPRATGYVIGDREYYLDVPEPGGWKLIVRKAGDCEQLLARAPEGSAVLVSDLIW